jgi:hypothetical protein
MPNEGTPSEAKEFEGTPSEAKEFEGTPSEAKEFEGTPSEAKEFRAGNVGEVGGHEKDGAATSPLAPSFLEVITPSTLGLPPSSLSSFAPTSTPHSIQPNPSPRKPCARYPAQQLHDAPPLPPPSPACEGTPSEAKEFEGTPSEAKEFEGTPSEAKEFSPRQSETTS